MSRYIDADAMKEWLDEYLSVFKKYDKSEVKGFVEHQPSIDIVRCRECKYAEIYDGYYTQVCCENGVIGGYGELWELDDFCSYGERKESE